jgi:uncharacterized protein
LIRNCSQGFDSVKFFWHGGEPLLAGIDFFKAVVAAQHDVTSEIGVTFENAVQSNGTLLNATWLKFLSKHHFSIGLSFDAPPDVHLSQRGRDPEESYRTWRQLADEGLPINILCVATAQNVERGEEIFQCFQAHGVNSYAFLPLRTVPLDTLPSIPTEHQLFELYRTTFELWTFRENTIRSIDPLATVVRALLGNRPQSCSFNGACLERMVTVDQDGNVVPCASLVSEEFVLGNVLSEPLIGVLASAKADRLRRQRERGRTEWCGDCEFLSACNGGCPSDAYWKSGVYGGRYPYCESRKLLFAYVRDRLTQIGTHVDDRLRLG